MSRPSAERAKYFHQIENTMSSPPTAIGHTSASPPSSKTAPSATEPASTDSPSTISVNRLYRSAMCPGCQGVAPRPSAMNGTASSAATSTTKPSSDHGRGTSSRSTQPACTTDTPSAIARSVPARAGSCRAARSHSGTSAIRITTYPRVTTPRSWASNARGTPAARISAPVIITNTARRKTTSSLSYADANHVKFIHAHQMAKNTISVAEEPRGHMRLGDRVVQFRSHGRHRHDEAEVEEQLERGRGPVRLGRVARRHRSAQHHASLAHASLLRLCSHQRSTASAAWSNASGRR